MKILLLNNYDLNRTLAEWQEDGQAEHQLWGITLLDKYEIKADIIQYQVYENLKNISQKLKILGDLDQEIRVVKQIYQYDLIYSGHYFTTSLLGLLRRLRILKKPIVAVAFQSPRPSFFSKIFVNLSIAGNDKIICLSDGIKKHLEDDFNISPKKLEFIEWGYNTEFHPPAPSNIAHCRQEGYILTAGKSFRDYDTLIKAFEEIDFYLEIIGYSDNILERLNSIPKHINITLTLALDVLAHLPNNYQVNQLPQNIKVLEKLLSTAQLLPKYHHAYAVAIPLALPEHKPYNTVGLSSLIEAMCMGKAVIATENQDMGVDLEKEGIGITVPLKDSLAWKQAIQYLLDHPQETQEMGQKARYLAEQKYNLGNFTQKVAQCMHKTLLNSGTDSK